MVWNKRWLLCGMAVLSAILLTACSSAAMEGQSGRQQTQTAAGTIPAERHIVRVTDRQGTTITLHLNDSQESKELLAQLPMDIDIENYSTNEKIFYPPNPLNTADTPMAKPHIGMVAYFKPWGNVVFFYDTLDGGELYDLGSVAEDSSRIRALSGTVHIEQIPQ